MQTNDLPGSTPFLIEVVRACFGEPPGHREVRRARVDGYPMVIGCRLVEEGSQRFLAHDRRHMLIWRVDLAEAGDAGMPNDVDLVDKFLMDQERSIDALFGSGGLYPSRWSITCDADHIVGEKARTCVWWAGPGFWGRLRGGVKSHAAV